MMEAELRRLAPEDILIRPCGDGEYIFASYFEENGWRHWDKYRLSELPNDLISLDDLKRFGINVINSETGGSEH